MNTFLAPYLNLKLVDEGHLYVLKRTTLLVLMVHAYNPRIWEAETGGSQSGLHSNTLSQKKSNNNNKKRLTLCIQGHWEVK
jgi:hypothetical protein